MSHVVFKNAKINDKITDIISEDGVITAVRKTDENGIDLKYKKVFPGLVDIHTHGLDGFDAMDGKLSELSKSYANVGTTAFCPTTMTRGLDIIQDVLDSAKKNFNEISRFLGFHLEGPFISENYIGAQRKEDISLPNIDFIKKQNNVSMITVAPEVEGAIEFIKNCGVKVSLGHTSATYKDGCLAAKAGANSLTHTFNAMKPLHHREPALIGCAFDNDMYVQVICDGIHIHPSAVRILYKLFGADRMILISDSMRATNLPDGKYEFGGNEVSVENSIAYTKDRNLAGSTSTLLYCVKKAIEFGIPESDAFKMATETPSEYIGAKTGKISVGYPCDFIVLNDDYSLDGVYIASNRIL